MVKPTILRDQLYKDIGGIPNIWYQSRRLNSGKEKTIGDYGINRVRTEQNRLRTRNDSVFKKGSWHKNRDEVLKRLEGLNIKSKPEKFRDPDLARKLKKARCYICRERRHIYWNCPNKRMLLNTDRSSEIRKKGKIEEIREQTNWSMSTLDNDKVQIDTVFEVNDTDSGNWNHIWFISDSIKNHMTPNIELLTDYRSHRKFEYYEGKILDIIGTGKVTIGENSITDVYYVKNIDVNVLSLSRLNSDDYDVELKNGSKCTLDKGWSNNDMEDDSIFENLKREAALDIAKRMVDDYVTKHCDRIGEPSGKGFYNDKHFSQDQILPNDLNSLVDFIDEILKKHGYEVRQVYRREFDKLVKWFHMEYLTNPEEKRLPPIIAGKQVCLMDLFRIVNMFDGAKNIQIKKQWDYVAMAMGFSENYGKEFKDCYIGYLQNLDIYYEIAKDTLDVKEEQLVTYKGKKVKLDVESFEGFMEFMGMMGHMPTVHANKRIFKFKFNKMITWFHTTYMDCLMEVTIPPKIGDFEVCLFDLHVLIENIGGCDAVTRKDDWGIVAQSFGFPECLKNWMKGIYERFLSLQVDYFKVAVADLQTRETVKSAGDNGDPMCTVGVVGTSSRKNDVSSSKGETRAVSGQELQEETEARKLIRDETAGANKNAAAGASNYEQVRVLCSGEEDLVITLEDHSQDDEDPEVTSSEVAESRTEEIPDETVDGFIDSE